jgi:hypothetical protein
VCLLSRCLEMGFITPFFHCYSVRWHRKHSLLYCHMLDHAMELLPVNALIKSVTIYNMLTAFTPYQRSRVRFPALPDFSEK